MLWLWCFILAGILSGVDLAYGIHEGPGQADRALIEAIGLMVTVWTLANRRQG